MARSIEDRRRALTTYLEARSVEATARLTGIPANTLQKWSKHDDWPAQLEKHLARAAEHPLEIPAKELKVLDDLEISSEKKDVLTQIKIVEGVCLMCIKDDEKTTSQAIKGLKPRSFVEAINALEKCWKARKELLYGDTFGGGGVNTVVAKRDYIHEMKVINQLKQREKLEKEEEE